MSPGPGPLAGRIKCTNLLAAPHWAGLSLLMPLRASAGHYGTPHRCIKCAPLATPQSSARAAAKAPLSVSRGRKAVTRGGARCANQSSRRACETLTFEVSQHTSHVSKEQRSSAQSPRKSARRCTAATSTRAFAQLCPTFDLAFTQPGSSYPVFADRAEIDGDRPCRPPRHHPRRVDAFSPPWSRIPPAWCRSGPRTASRTR